MKLTKSLTALTVGALAVGQAGCCLCKKKEPVCVAPAPMCAPACAAPVTTNYCPPAGAPGYPYAPAMMGPSGPTLAAPGY